jgi:hypothetical protein
MSDRGYANADQIVSGQVRRHLGVNIILAKSGLVAFEPESAQPFGHIHGVAHKRQTSETLLPRRSVLSRLPLKLLAPGDCQGKITRCGITIRPWPQFRDLRIIHAKAAKIGPPSNVTMMAQRSGK